MLSNAVFITTLIFMGLGIVFLQACPFLIPYRHLLFMKYGLILAKFATLLFVNLLAAVYMICRIVFLKEAGRKLAHLEKQVRSGDTWTDDLTRRLDE